MPEKKKLHAGTSLAAGAIHFFTHTALVPEKCHGTLVSASAVFTPAILSPRLHSVPRWANMSNQVQPSHKLGQQKGLTVLKMGNKTFSEDCWWSRGVGVARMMVAITN